VSTGSTAVASDFSEYADTCTAVATSSHGASRKPPPRQDAGVAWPGYDWMGVAKAGLESASRYLARELGPRRVRCNLISAGPLRTMAAKSIPGFSTFEDAWTTRAPLGWSNSDLEPVARSAVALLSDWFPATTGEIVHVDGGFHAMGV
jgi:enoyl ACP reductase